MIVFMGNVKLYDTRFLCQLEPRRMFKFGSMFLVLLRTFLLNIFGFICKFVCRSKAGAVEVASSNFGASHSHKDDGAVSNKPPVLLSSGLAEEESLDLQRSMNFIAETEDSVFFQSKCQFVSGENVIGFMEEPKTVSFTVMDMFVGSNDVMVRSNQSCDREISQRLEANLQDFDEGKEPPSFTFKLFSSFAEDVRHKQDHENIFQEKTGDPPTSHLNEDVYVEEEKLCAADSEEFRFVGDEIMDDRDFSYEVELLPPAESSSFNVNKEYNAAETDTLIHTQRSSDAAETDTFIRTQKDSDAAQVDALISTHKMESCNEAVVERNDCKIWDFFSFDLTDQKDPMFINEDHKMDRTRLDIPSATPDTFRMTGRRSASSPRNEDDTSESNTYFTCFDVKSSVQGTERAEHLVPDQDIGYMHWDAISVKTGTAQRSPARALFDDGMTKLRNDQSCPDIGDSVPGTDRTADLDDDDDEYIELEPPSQIGTEDLVSGDANKSEESDRHDSDSEDEDEPDVLKEHQNLVQQMKMELKNCRVRGLPTISEECETPRMAEDMKPLEVDQKFEYKDVMEEIQKFHKRYMDKMRKLDILNYQTLQGISFLQLKESEVFTAGKKKSASVSFMLPEILAFKVQRIYAAPTHKSIIGMHQDLELVYVGQLCLSWEILSWLHLKARELLEYNCKSNHLYNRVAEEFQQFQVLVQRFMEDEPFQGQRIQNYVRSRCMMRSLLQVPAVRDDCSKDKKERGGETDAISLELVVDIIWESMLLFWEFLRGDKRSTNVVLKGIHGTEADLQDPSRSKLIVDTITSLQKKERRIREHMRSQNCIVKKLKKHPECQSNPELFKSQVELRLVSRVLGLSRLTADQLAWCQMKLNCINFVGKKVHLEPSFLLFPC